VLDSRTPKWHTQDLAACDEMVIQKQKDATKLLAQEKWNEQFTEEVRASYEAVKADAEQTKAMEKAVAAGATMM